MGLHADPVTNSTRIVNIGYDKNGFTKRGINGYAQILTGQGNFPICADYHFTSEQGVKDSVKDFLNNGYKPENIRLNGQPVTDMFEKNDKGEYVEKAPKSGKLKTIGTTAASAAIPGAGQIINGEYKKAGLYMIGNVVLSNCPIAKDLLRIHSAYDAYKNSGKKLPDVEKT